MNRPVGLARTPSGVMPELPWHAFASRRSGSRYRSVSGRSLPGCVAVADDSVFA